MSQNAWDAVKAAVRGKFIAIQSYLKRQEKSQINILTLQLNQLEKEKQNTVRRRKEILKIRSEINEKEMKETIEKINKINSWFFVKISKIYELLPDSSRKQERRHKPIKLAIKKENL